MSELAINQTAQQTEAEFQENMKKRLRPIIGELMTDEMLLGIATRGIEEAFFKPITTKTGYGYNEKTEQQPSWAVTFIRKEAEAQIQTAVEKWVATNQHTFAAIIDKLFEKGMASACVNAFDNLLQQELYSMKTNINNMVMKLRDKHGINLDQSY